MASGVEKLEESDSSILFFIKYPDPGLVKTRLSHDLGPDEAADLYGRFVQHMLGKLRTLGHPLVICFHPEQKRQVFVDWLGTEYEFLPQYGADLGERMECAFDLVFAQMVRKAVLVGGDIPDLPTRFIKDALVELETFDVVLGPAMDGGYYLIGFRNDSFTPEVFKDVSWSTKSVLNKTISALKEARRSVFLLPQWEDVDTPEDYKRLLQRFSLDELEQFKRD